MNNRPPEKISGGYFHSALSLLALLVLITFVACSAPEEKKMRFYNKGLELYANSEYEKAAVEFGNAIRVDPIFADAHYMLGMTLRKQDNPEKAYISLNRAIVIDPTHLKARIQLGDLLLVGGYPERAMEKVKQILAENPKNKEARFLEAEIHISVNEIEKAVSLMEEMISSDIREAEPFLLLAKAHIVDDNIKGAEEALLRGIEENENSIQLRRILADVYRDQWKMDEAVAQVRWMIAIEPHNHDHKIELAVLCWDAGLRDTALDILSELLLSLGQDEETRMKVAGFLVSRGAYENAEIVLKNGIEKEGKALLLRLGLAELYRNVAGVAGMERAVAILEEALGLAGDEWGRDVVRMRMELAVIHLARGELDKASVRVEEVTQKDPRNIDARRARGHILLEKGDAAGATAEFQSLIKDRPLDVLVHLLLAQSLLAEGKEIPALDALHSAFRLAPQSVEVYRALVRHHTLREEFETAEAYLLKAIEDHQKNLELRAELGDLYIAWNNPGKAFATYEEIKKTAPAHPLGYLKMGSFLAARGKWDRAAREYRMAIDRNPLDLGVYLLLGECYTQGRRYEKAKETYREALQRQPDFAAAQRALDALN
ncbi:MAG: tetratricopeptide repeat protein [Syntrophorhabdaceae bacterium]|nr:tetratricopeptide repeat protein [Syntrophorhabdaceae bacterium]